MFISSLILTIFLTLILYFLVGIFKKQFFISIPAGGLSADYAKDKRTGWSAVVLGIATMLLVLFGLVGFTDFYNISYTSHDYVISIILSSSLVYFIKIAERKLPKIKINPFKVLIPTLVMIIFLTCIFLILFLILK